MHNEDQAYLKYIARQRALLLKQRIEKLREEDK